MNNNRFFTLETEIRKQHYQIPKQFMNTQSKYHKMSSDAKLIYGVLADRNSLSIKNGWVNDKGQIYFKYSQDSLGEALGMTRQTVAKRLKELEKAELLYRKRIGLGQSDELYLLQVEVEENLADQSYQQKLKKLTSVSEKNLHQEVKEFNTNNTDSNNTDSNNTYSSSSKEEIDDEDLKSSDLDFLLEVCRNKKINIEAKDLKDLLTYFDVNDIGRILIAMKNKIDNPFAYIHKSLVNNAKKNVNKITQVVEKKDKSNTSNFNAAKTNEHEETGEEILDIWNGEWED